MMTPEQFAEKLTQASRKHGKPFAIESKVQRITKPSWRLLEIMNQAPKQTKVIQIRKESK